MSGFDGGKKVKRLLRHFVVDSQDFLIGMLERLGAVIVLHQAKEKLEKLEVVWVNQGYSGPNFEANVKKICVDQVRVEVIKRSSKEFEVLAKRWIVERTFGWLNRFRRLRNGISYSTTQKCSNIFFTATCVVALATYEPATLIVLI